MDICLHASGAAHQAQPARREEPLILLPLRKSIESRLLAAQAAARRHPGRMAAAVLLMLGGFGVTAFGIAPLAPDAAALPKRLVVEQLPVPGLDAQLEALALHPLQLDRHEITRSNDTADTLLRRLGVADPLAAAYLRRDREARRLVDGQGNKMVQVRTDAEGNLQSLVARFPALDNQRAGTHFTRLTITRSADGFRSLLETAPLQPQNRMGSGTIRSSLWAATDDAQLPDAIATQLIEIFSGDVDFHRQLKRGDSFSVLFEALTADGQPITWNEGTGRVLAAEFINGGRQLQAVWFQDANKGRGAYFGPDGNSRQRAFLASPLAFSRITSGFAQRFHPILQNWRAHNGVDYSAPTGTPVRVVGDGVIELAGRQSGYGNVVQVVHASGRSTLYAHLSRIDVRLGQRVEQGQTLGAVGATGWATGPHLHFEFRVNGQFQDPLTIARASESLHIDGTAKPRFEALATVAQRHLQAAESMTAFRGNAE